jgi:hypothetical protein
MREDGLARSRVAFSASVVLAESLMHRKARDPGMLSPPTGRLHQLPSAYVSRPNRFRSAPSVTRPAECENGGLGTGSPAPRA